MMVSERSTKTERKHSQRKRDLVFKYTIILVGVMMVAFAVSALYTPNKIVSGGVSGIATILYHTLHIPTGLSFAAINGVLLLLALFILGKQFVLDTIAVSLLLSLFVQLFSYIPPLTHNVFLATIFGSVLYGTGIGLTLALGASSGGTDIVGRLLQKAFPYIRIGTVLLVVDSLVILTSLVLFGEVDLALYGVIALAIASFSINRLIQLLNVSKLAFVISNNGVELSKELVSHSPRGVTIINATGGYTMTEKQVLLCALKEKELENFQQQVSAIDPEAFVIFSESQQIVGKGFRVYR